MRSGPSTSQTARLISIIKDYEKAGIAVDLRLEIDGKDYSDRLESGDWGISKDDVAWTLSCNLSGWLPADIVNSPTKLIVDIDGIVMVGFYGRISIPTPKPEYYTEFNAATPGALLGKVALREETEYLQRSPEFIIRDALYRVQFYDKGQIRIPEYNKPLIDRVEDDAFNDDQHPSDILDTVKEEISAQFYDTPTGGHVVLPFSGAGEGLPVVWTYDATDDREVFVWTPPAFASPDEQFTSVVVRHRDKDGDNVIEEEQPVNYFAFAHPPATDQTLYIEFTEEFDEADLNHQGAAQRARQLATDNANALSLGTYNGQHTVAFNHLLEPGDIISFDEEYEDDSGLYHRRWRCVIEGMKHSFGEALETVLDTRCYLMRIVKISELNPAIPGVTPGSTSVGIAGIPFGEDLIGPYIDPDLIPEPPWAGEDETGDWVDDDLSGGITGEDLTGDYIDA